MLHSRPTASRTFRQRLIVLLALAAFSLAGGSHAFAGTGKVAKTNSTHPVIPGFERFFAGPKADAATGGRLLLGELNCTSCHQPEAAQADLLLRRQAPNLDGVGNRVKRSGLRKFLADPHGVKPGTTMPDVFAGVPEQERKQKVEELVHFLASTGSVPQERPEVKFIAAGRDLYSRVGCVACHGSRDSAGNADKVLPTSVPLGDLKAKYSLRSLATFLNNPLHARPSGRMPTLLNAKEAREVANYLLQGIPYDAPTANVTYAYYEGSWDKLPDFDKLKPRATGKASGFDLTRARRQNNMAMKFEGYLRIDREGDYRFYLTSDDGSKLFLDGKLVVANDGIHPATTVAGSVRLTREMHRFVVGVFNGGGGVELQVEMEGPGLGRQPVTPLVFLTPLGNPAVPKNPGAREEDFALDPALVENGRQAFVSVGCASCHTLKVGGKLLEAKRKAPSLAKLRPEAGCLAQAHAAGTPRYVLSDAQRSALAAAVKAPASPSVVPTPRAVIARNMTAFNCYACHQRDKVGGVEEALNPFFTTTEREMGDEGRVPPALTGVGAKLTAAYLKKVLADGAHDRPYMHTRMPGFGEANTAALVKAFQAADTLEPVARPVFRQKLPRVKADGRHMVGAIGGSALGCVKCHTFAGHKAEGVQGIDMTLMPKRVQRDWFHRYVLDPQKFRPGTRMPSSWPNGVSFFPDMQEGDTAKQVEAIWVYLTDGKAAFLPLGLNRQFIPLIPEKDAIVYRNFLVGAGPRAIGVGYPEKANLAFDANEVKLAAIWQGAFIDAARHWTDRGVGFEPPLGDNVLHPQPGVALAVLAKDGDAWPTRPARELGYKFKGYRLTPDQRPTFLYSYAGVEVEDFPNAVAGKPAPSLRRTLTLTVPLPPVNRLWFRAAVGDKIEALGDGWYRINGEWRMRIEADSAPVLRQSGGKQELLLPVRFIAQRARILQEIVW